jgi:hypothetical protein
MSDKANRIGLGEAMNRGHGERNILEMLGHEKVASYQAVHRVVVILEPVVFLAVMSGVLWGEVRTVARWATPRFKAKRVRSQNGETPASKGRAKGLLGIAGESRNLALAKGPLTVVLV